MINMPTVSDLSTQAADPGDDNGFRPIYVTQGGKSRSRNRSFVRHVQSGPVRALLGSILIDGELVPLTLSGGSPTDLGGSTKPAVIHLWPAVAPHR